VGLDKASIRVLSRRLGLKTWGKQSFACLSSRIPYGEEITPELLNIIDDSEQFLLDRGFSPVRVRVHGRMARIEIAPEQFQDLLTGDLFKDADAYLKQRGFLYVSLDLAGYRTGSMNIGLTAQAKGRDVACSYEPELQRETDAILHPSCQVQGEMQAQTDYDSERQQYDCLP
jgi:pyridinium-3,5-biscarboxylic acid mononucleotide sulfurtransferase